MLLAAELQKHCNAIIGDHQQLEEKGEEEVLIVRGIVVEKQE